MYIPISRACFTGSSLSSNSDAHVIVATASNDKPSNGHLFVTTPTQTSPRTSRHVIIHPPVDSGSDVRTVRTYVKDEETNTDSVSFASLRQLVPAGRSDRNITHNESITYRQHNTILPHSHAQRIYYTQPIAYPAPLQHTCCDDPRCLHGDVRVTNYQCSSGALVCTDPACLTYASGGYAAASQRVVSGCLQCGVAVTGASTRCLQCDAAVSAYDVSGVTSTVYGGAYAAQHGGFHSLGVHGHSSSTGGVRVREIRESRAPRRPSRSERYKYTSSATSGSRLDSSEGHRHATPQEGSSSSSSSSSSSASGSHTVRVGTGTSERRFQRDIQHERSVGGFIYQA